MRKTIDNPPEKSLHDELLAIVEEHDNAWRDAMRSADEDFRFAVLGEQWAAEDKKRRESEKRPALVYNRLPAFIRRVTNEARQDDQQVRVIPCGDEASIVTADILQGVIRGIQITSDASSARATAHEAAAIGGFGWYRIGIVTENGEKVIRLLRVRDASQVTLDPWASEADRSDAKTAVVRESISKAEYQKRFPEGDLASLEDSRDISSGWISENTVRIAEVWRIVKDKAERYIIDGQKVLEEYPSYPGRYIPIVPIFGEEWEIDGKVIFKGLVRDAKTPCIMLNYWKSATAENLAQNRRARADVTPGMLDGFESEWADDSINSAYRHYNPGPNGERPTYPSPPQIPTGTVQAAGSDSDELKAIMGIFDASLGAKSNETSGRAIMARAAQGDLATYHFKDNLSRAIRLEGKILVDLIPHVYGTKQFLQVAAEDGQITSKEVGAIHKLTDGKAGYVGVTGGTYGVVVQSGPGYATKRQETLNLMIDAARVVPQIAQLGADKMIGLMDFNGSFELAQRIKASLPPGVIQDDGEQANPLKMKAAIDQAHQTIEQLTEALQKTSEELAAAKNTAENDYKNKVVAAQMQAEIDLATAKMKAETDIQIAQIKAETDIEVAKINEAAKIQQSQIMAESRQVEAALKTPPRPVLAPDDGMYCEPDSPGLSPVPPLEEAQYVD